MPPPNDDNALQRENQAVHRDVIARRDEILARHQAHEAITPPNPLGDFTNKVRAILPGASGLPVGELLVDLVERDRFGADLALKFPALLKNGGPRRFAAEYAPAIHAALEGPEFAEEIATVASVGMYINVKLRDEWLLQAARSVATAGPSYGRSYPSRQNDSWSTTHRPMSLKAFMPGISVRPSLARCFLTSSRKPVAWYSV